MAIRILIADDHGLLRAGLRSLLNSESGMLVVGEAEDTANAVRLAAELQPDIILMDISMPGAGGIEATRQLKEISPNMNILIMTVHEDKGMLREAIHAGAGGYILKKAVESELVNAIQAVLRGELYVHPAMTRALLPDIAREPTRGGPVEPLTPRELDVLRLIVQGYTNRQMAESLSLSVRTIESHRSNLMGKLNLHSRVELVRYAQEHGLFNDE